MVFGAQRVGANSSFVAVILAPVHEYFSSAQAFFHFCDNEIGMMTCQSLGHRASEGLGDFVSSGRVEGDVNLQTFRPGSFGEAFEFESVELRFEPLRDLGALENVGRWPGVEIENDHRRTFDILSFGEKGMKFEVSEVRSPDNGRQIVGHAIMNLGIMTLGPDSRGLYPFRPIRRAAFFVEKPPGDAVRVAFEREGPVFEVRQQNGRDADVIVNDLPFGEAAFRIENFIEIRNRDRFAVDFERRFASSGREAQARAPASGRAFSCPRFQP